MKSEAERYHGCKMAIIQGACDVVRVRSSRVQLYIHVGHFCLQHLQKYTWLSHRKTAQCSVLSITQALMQTDHGTSLGSGHKIPQRKILSLIHAHKLDTELPHLAG